MSSWADEASGESSVDQENFKAERIISQTPDGREKVRRNGCACACQKRQFFRRVFVLGRTHLRRRPLAARTRAGSACYQLEAEQVLLLCMIFAGAAATLEIYAVRVTGQGHHRDPQE